MDGQISRMQHQNGGIKCLVNTCYYYGSGDHCHAEKIEIQSRNASTSEMTDCVTFVNL